MTKKQIPPEDDRYFEAISLESLGTHLFFGMVDNATIKASTEFLIKSHYLSSKIDELTIFLNSSGGECGEAFALIDLMQVSNKPIKIVGIGNVKSMAVLILAAGTKGKRYMTRHTEVMAHQFSGGISEDGKFHEIESMFKSQLLLKEYFYRFFLANTKMTKAQIDEFVFNKTDIYLTAEQCKELGIIDEIIETIPVTPNVPVQPARSGRTQPSLSKRRTAK